MGVMTNPSQQIIETYQGLNISLRINLPARSRRVYCVELPGGFAYASSLQQGRELIDKAKINPMARFCRVSGYWATPAHLAQIDDLCTLDGVSQSDLFHRLLDEAWKKDIGSQSRVSNGNDSSSFHD